MLRWLGLPVEASAQATDIDQIIVLVHWLMALLTIGWTLYFFYALWRFREARNRKAVYEGVTGHASTWLEVFVVSFEAVLLIGFAVPLWARAVDDFPDAAGPSIAMTTCRVRCPSLMPTSLEPSHSRKPDMTPRRRRDHRFESHCRFRHREFRMPSPIDDLHA